MLTACPDDLDSLRSKLTALLNNRIGVKLYVSSLLVFYFNILNALVGVVCSCHTVDLNTLFDFQAAPSLKSNTQSKLGICTLRCFPLTQYNYSKTFSY